MLFLINVYFTSITIFSAHSKISFFGSVSDVCEIILSRRINGFLIGLYLLVNQLGSAGMHLHIDFVLFLIVEVIVLKLGLEFFVVDLLEQILELLIVLVFEGVVDKFARKVVSV